MKSPKTSMIIGLAVLLVFRIPITWADKKTGIIAGSVGGGAAAVIGGALWYKLRNYDTKVRYYYDNKLLNVKSNDFRQLSDELKAEGIKWSTVFKLKSKIDNILKINNERKSADVFIKVGHNGDLDFSIVSDKELIGSGSVEKGSNNTNKVNEIRVNSDNLRIVSPDINASLEVSESVEPNYPDSQNGESNLGEIDNVNNFSIDESMSEFISNPELGNLTTIDSTVGY